MSAIVFSDRLPVIHTLKCWPEPFDAIVRGEKRFEWRRNDRDFRVGDLLLLQRFCPREGQRTGETALRAVTYVLAEGFYLPPGFVILSLE